MIKGKKYVFNGKNPSLPILMWLIKNNRLNEVISYLTQDKHYFYPQTKCENGFDRYMNETANIKENSCYTAAAVKQKNPEMLKLLLSHGFAFEIINDISPPSENETLSFGMASINYPKYIDPAHPFITEDEAIFEILIKNVKDINQTCILRWTEDGMKFATQQELSLLGMALYFNKMKLAEVLIRNGAKIEFNLYNYMLNYLQELLKCGFTNSALTNGYKNSEMSSDDTLEFKHEWFPIGIILRRGNVNQIDWLMKHAEHNPPAMREIAMSLHFLKKERFRLFINKYPEFIRLLDWRSICYYSNEDALYLYLRERKPSLTKDNIIDLLNFELQSYKPLNEIFDSVLPTKLYKCVRLLYNYSAELFRDEEVQKHLYNTALYISFMDYALCKDDTKERKIPELLDFYDKIATHTPDASMFIRWYYLRGRYSSLYRLNARDAVYVIKMCQRPGQNAKTKINISTSIREGTYLTQAELAAIIEIFQFYSEDETLSNLYKLLIQKDSIPLVKKLLASSAVDNKDLHLLTEYAIEAGAQKLIQLLLFYKMKTNKEALQNT